MANTVTRNNNITKKVERARVLRGVQVAVARRLGISRAHVSLVVWGHRSSRRVALAVAEEVDRIEKTAA